MWPFTPFSRPHKPFQPSCTHLQAPVSMMVPVACFRECLLTLRFFSEPGNQSLTQTAAHPFWVFLRDKFSVSPPSLHKERRLIHQGVRVLRGKW